MTTPSTPPTPSAPSPAPTPAPSSIEPALREILLRGEARVTRSSEGVWVACFTMPTSFGPLQLCATVNERYIAPALVRFLAQHYGSGAVSGFSVEHIAQLARRIARGRVLRRLLASAREVIQDPRVAQAVGLASVAIPVVGPALGAATVVARTATTAIARAQHDPAARSRLEQLARAAAQGHPQARQALDILRAVAPAVQTAIRGGAPVAAATATLSPEALRAVQQAVSGAPPPPPNGAAPASSSWTSWLPRRSDRQAGLAVLAQTARPIFSTGR
ncbi:MAG: hypothetical protein IT293_04155 [Deltaproteobacteria bacterium]|nr:hypothetical protein [Deltaproteobacteria bacterium]